MLNNFGDFVLKVESPKVLTTNCNLQNGVVLCIIIGDVHLFNDHCGFFCGLLDFLLAFFVLKNLLPSPCVG